MQALFIFTVSVNLRQQCFIFVSYFEIISSKNWPVAAHSRWDLECIILDMFLILSFGFLCLWPAAAHSRWEGQYDKCIAGGGGADTGRFLCSASSKCSALLFFISLFFAFTFLTREHKCIVVLLERGVGAHTPHFLLFALASMLILIQIHAYTCTFPFFYFNLRNSLGQPLVKKEATDWDFIFCKSGWSTLAYNILRIGLEPKIKKAISDH